MISEIDILNRVKRRVNGVRACTEDDVHGAWMIELRKAIDEERIACEALTEKMRSDVNGIQLMLSTPMLRFPKTGVRQYTVEQYDRIESALRALTRGP